MPELPEVETIARDLQMSVLKKTIIAVDVIDPYVVKQPKAQFIRQLVNQQIQHVERRGKALVMTLGASVILSETKGLYSSSSSAHQNDKLLIIQLMMTGQLVFNGTPDKHTRVFFTLDDDSKILYNDQRRFGHLRVVKALSEINYFNILGPEPLTANFTPDYFYGRARQSARPIKNFLLDHTVVAGIGNIYACEILFRAGISPKRKAGRITRPQAALLYQHTVEVLNEAIAARGSSIRNYRDGTGKKGGFSALMQVYGRDDQPCRVCQEPIKRISQAGRSSFYCVKCQR